MKKYIHAWRVGLFIIYFVCGFISLAPSALALALAPHLCCSSVAFIPGIEASRLYTPGVLIENKLWEPFWNFDIDKLDMDSTGNSIRSDIYTRDIVDHVKVGLINTSSDVYENFIAYMDGLVFNHTIQAWKALPYDWRLGLNDVVDKGVLDEHGNISYLSSTTSDLPYMISQIQTLADSSMTGKVTIVAHSNGGLVAEALIQKLQALKAQGISNLVDQIDNVIMVSTPQLGAVDSIATLLHGYDTHYLGGFIANESHARALAENMPSAYNLLPSLKYFENNSGPLITFATSTDPFNSFSKFYGRNISDAATLDKFLSGADGRSTPDFSDTNDPGILNGALIANAQNQHNLLDNWQFPSSIKVTKVAGVGIETLSGISYEKGYVCSTDISMCEDTLDPEPVKSIDGDGTVLTYSALSGQGGQLYFDLNKYNDPETGDKHNRQHSDILETKNIQDLITGLLDGGNNLPDLITTNKPIIEDKQLLVAAHSPISLDAYDAKGNHTGLIDNPDSNSDIQLVEQKIPNSSYENFGEGKYLNIESNASTTIVFQGTDYGSFTIDTTLFQGDSVIATSTFVDIPVTPELKGSIINITSSTPALALDVDGDGVVDITTTAVNKFDPILYIEIMKKTINSFNLKKNAEKLLVQKLDQLETKIKKGKLNNADKKIKGFIKKINRKGVRMRKITDNEKDQLIQMLSNLADNLL